MNWFDIIKLDNPKSLYSQEEIRDMALENEDNRELYGFDANVYYGNLKYLKDLRYDYDVSFFNDMWSYNYFIKEIVFELQHTEGFFRTHLKFGVYAVDYRGGNVNGIMRDFSDSNLKVAADFVEIYNQPNHRYKNLVARLGDGLDEEMLKELLQNKQMGEIIEVLKELKL